MLRMQKWLMDNADRVVATIVSETGKTYEDAYMAEINYAGGAIDFWARNAEKFLADESIRATTVAVLGKKLVVRYEPLGLIGVIGPWNYPLTNSFGDCIPAMLAGNSVILKPSEITPLTSILLAEGLAESGLPDGVFQVATGRGATGAALVDEVDMVMFTGSTATGKKVMARAAETLTPVALELGGKDPMIVLADADLERAANLAVYYSMLNGGQTCISIERVYVEEPAYDAFVQKVVEKVGALRQGESSGPATFEVGAMTFAKQLEIVEEHVRDALAKGARALTGGKRRRRHGALLRADRARRRRPHDEGDDRGDVRADAADHEGDRRRAGARARQRLAVRARRGGLHAATAAAASSSRGGCRPARSASTTRC